jgi:hypothetical protein
MRVNHVPLLAPAFCVIYEREEEAVAFATCKKGDNNTRRTTTRTSATINTTTATTTPNKPSIICLYVPKFSSYQKTIPKKVKAFFDYIGLPGKNLEEQGQVFLDKARENQQWAEENILLFLDFQKQRVLRKELAAGTLKNLCLAIKTFYDAHDDLLPSLNWKRLSRALPRAKSSSNDRAPTIEEIRKLVEYPDRRIKPIVYTMCSSGIRLGAWDYLRWKHVFPIMPNNEKDGEVVVAAKLLVYAGEPEEYYTFITPEAYNALKDWMDFRVSYGEKITGESWVMRNIWRTVDVVKRMGEEEKEKGGRFGLATHPKKLPSNSIKKY